MIIYGYRQKGVIQARLDGQVCEHCGSSDLYGVGSMKYIHVFWLPFIALGKKVNQVCTHCKANKTAKELDKETKQNIKDVVFKDFGFFNILKYNLVAIVLGLLLMFSMVQ